MKSTIPKRIKNLAIPTKKAMSPVAYEGLPREKIPTDYGAGMTFKDDEETLFEIMPRDPVVYLRITTFRGLGAEAIHYYGSLSIDEPSCKVLQSNSRYHTNGDISWIGGAFSKFKPKEALSLHIELERRLTPAELRTDRFRDYAQFKEPLTNCFYTKTDIRVEARRVLEKHFGPGWKLKERDL